MATVAALPSTVAVSTQLTKMSFEDSVETIMHDTMKLLLHANEVALCWEADNLTMHFLPPPALVRTFGPILLVDRQITRRNMPSRVAPLLYAHEAVEIVHSRREIEVNTI
jgi:hypothetical protein